jgi:hypothetical protein
MLEIHCHKGERHIRGMENDHWREPRLDAEPYGYPFRTCSYCGSMHPEDLEKFLNEGATLDMADWKYGWPHKFYVEGIPNPQVGKMVNCGSKSYFDEEKGERVDEPLIQMAPTTTFAKFYNLHLGDLADTDLERIALLIEKLSRVYVFREKGALKFQTNRQAT